MQNTPEWPDDIFRVLQEQKLHLVTHVPDAGHSQLIRRCDSSSEFDVVTLTTEQDGIGLLAGAWAGNRKGVLLMQSSGVGNCINALALPAICRVPLLTIISMRGEWGEFVPWQVPMGQATPAVLQAMDVHVFRIENASETYDTVDAAAKFAYNTKRSCAVLLSQRLIGAKQFTEGA